MGASGPGISGWEASWQRFVEHVQTSPGRMAVPLRREVFQLARGEAGSGDRAADHGPAGGTGGPAVADDDETGQGGLPDELATFVEVLARRSQDMTDDQITELRDAGYSEDQIFEAIVVAAVGAASARLDAVHRAREGS